jgi:hypothetical protein
MKHYSQRNDGMLKDANKIWTNYAIERTNMLFAKDNYYNEMCTLTQMKRQLEESKGFDPKQVPQSRIA